ncbi:MAG: CotH kinase family protein [Lachnospiraceae bacterium]|nr:CotH kinase family protein [Lachnospiraceae bacterium]
MKREKSAFPKRNTVHRKIPGRAAAAPLVLLLLLFVLLTAAVIRQAVGDRIPAKKAAAAGSSLAGRSGVTSEGGGQAQYFGPRMFVPDASQVSESSVLPCIYLETEEEIGDSYGTARILITENLSGEEATVYEGGTQIKLRGNSTRWRDKKPYKIKLANKADLFGMGGSKHWVLLANDIDHTLIRNKLVLDFARSVGMENASRSVLVSLYLNGRYEGVYQLTEQIRVEEHRVEIHDWEDAFGERKALPAEEVEDDGVPQTGGFLLEADFYSPSDAKLSHLITAFKQPFYFNTPEYVRFDTELYQYTKDYIQSFEYALHASDHTYHAADTHYEGRGDYYDYSAGVWRSTVTESDYHSQRFDGMHYTRLFDMDSLLQNLLICEISANWDCMKNSVFLYKDIEGPAYMGPPWDFDWAFGNINMYNIDTWIPTKWQTTCGYFTREQYYQSVQWNRYLIRDPYFVMRFYELYHAVRETSVQDLLDAAEGYESYLAYDGAKNDERWGYTYTERYYSGVRPGDYGESCERLQEFLTQRIVWMDRQFADYETLLASLGAYVPDREITGELLEVTAKGDARVTVSLGAYGDRSMSAELQINGTGRMELPLSKDGTATAKIPAELLRSGGNVVEIRPVDDGGQYLYPGEKPDIPAVSGLLTFELP